MNVKRKIARKVPRRQHVVRKPIQSSVPYEQDFYKWTQHQAKFLKKKDYAHLDIKNLVEEIGSLGRSDKRALKSHCIVLFLHLLKRKYQHSKQTPSWNYSIKNARLEIRLILEDSPSLKKEMGKILESAYEYAREKAAIETGLDISAFPIRSPFLSTEIFSD